MTNLPTPLRATRMHDGSFAVVNARREYVAQAGNQNIADCIVLAVNKQAALIETLERVTAFAHAALSGSVHDDNLKYYESLAKEVIRQARGE